MVALLRNQKIFCLPFVSSNYTHSCSCSLSASLLWLKILRQLFYLTTLSNPLSVGVINLQNFEVQ